MYKIFESDEDNKKIFEAYTLLGNVQEEKIAGGDIVIFSFLHTGCIIQQLLMNFIRELLRKINLSG